MFLNHFKMNGHPFLERPPVEWILNANRIAQSLARLDYFSRQGTLALVIGQTGVGKSTLLRLFIQNLSKNRYRPLYLHFTVIPSSSLLRLIVTQLGEAPRRGKDNLFLQPNGHESSSLSSPPRMKIRSSGVRCLVEQAQERVEQRNGGSLRDLT